MNKKVFLLSLLVPFLLGLACGSEAPPVIQPTFTATIDPELINSLEKDIAAASIKAHFKIANNDRCFVPDLEVADLLVGIRVQVSCTFSNPTVIATFRKFETVEEMNNYLNDILSRKKIVLNDTWNYQGETTISGNLYTYYGAQKLLPTVMWTLISEKILAQGLMADAENLDVVLEWWKTTGSATP